MRSPYGAKRPKQQAKPQALSEANGAQPRGKDKADRP